MWLIFISGIVFLAGWDTCWWSVFIHYMIAAFWWVPVCIVSVPYTLISSHVNSHVSMCRFGCLVPDLYFFRCMNIFYCLLMAFSWFVEYSLWTIFTKYALYFACFKIKNRRPKILGFWMVLHKYLCVRMIGRPYLPRLQIQPWLYPDFFRLASRWFAFGV